MRTTVIILSLLVLALPARADENAGSVRVRILELTRVPDHWKGLNLAVRTAIASRFLYQTPGIKGARRPWNRALRVYTAYSLPVVFKVVEPDAVVRRTAAVRKPKARLWQRTRADEAQSDETLATGLDDLVADYGPSGEIAANGPTDPDDDSTAYSYPVGADVVRTLCKTKLKWPPADGEHRLECGGAVLLVSTRRLGR
ncbi:MAG: hypothetical protein ISR64_10530 [Deltaproteobacteria bacterium]|nr:hypothetical protein [Deltaproteobacteria bacterium]